MRGKPSHAHKPSNIKAVCFEDDCNEPPAHHVQVDTGGDTWYDVCASHFEGLMPDRVKGLWEWEAGDTHG